jgi:Uma2 family endonuclease
MSATVITESWSLPTWVTDLVSFRKWVHIGQVPERGRFGYLAGILWVDLTKERLIHNRIKMAIARDLDILATLQGGGFYLGDGILLTNLKGDLSCEPDGMYIANASIDVGRVLMEEGEASLEIVGSPDMVLEVISSSSVEKDTKILPKLYWKARVREYWLVDSRDSEPQLRIYRRGPTRYAAVRSTAGWVKSAVFGKSFRLVRRAAGSGNSEYTLVVK